MILFGLLMALTADQPAFEFKGLRPGTPPDMDRVTNCFGSSDKRICDLKDKTVAGVDSLTAVAVYSKNLMTHVLIDVRAYQGNQVLAALKQKYGIPCEEGDREVQNGFGARFNRHVVEWCFSDGTAAFHSLGSKPNTATFFFHIPAIEQASKPVVDF